MRKLPRNITSNFLHGQSATPPPQNRRTLDKVRQFHRRLNLLRSQNLSRLRSVSLGALRSPSLSTALALPMPTGPPGTSFPFLDLCMFEICLAWERPPPNAHPRMEMLTPILLTVSATNNLSLPVAFAAAPSGTIMKDGHTFSTKTVDLR